MEKVKREKYQSLLSSTLKMQFHPGVQAQNHCPEYCAHCGVLHLTACSHILWTDSLAGSCALLSKHNNAMEI